MRASVREPRGMAAGSVYPDQGMSKRGHRKFGKPCSPITPFVRDAKSESARRVNTLRKGRFRWARGYYAGSLSHSHIPAARNYLATQYARHPDRVPRE